MKKGLIIIDVQNDYFKGGAMELVGMEDAAENCRTLLENFREAGLPIFHVQHFSIQEGAAFFIPNTTGSEIHESVTPREDEVLITKNYPSAFRDTGLHGILQKSQVKELVVCGAMSHMCIDTTVRAAFDSGYSCRLISDACATRNLEFEGKVIKASDVHAAFMASLGGPFAAVLTTQAFLKST
ncbi:cysteine hydrolase family protein [Thermodesulfobacteriota bacterium]